MIIAIISVASLFDVYFENNLVQFDEIESESANNPAGQSKMYFVNQTNSITAKTSANKDSSRKLQIKSHDKFIQKYHQLRNYQVLKAEVKTLSSPLILSYHYLIFRNYFFSSPDDVPLKA